MDDHQIREILARGMRVLANEVAPDNRGHVSFRPPGEDRVYIVGRLHIFGRTMASTTYDDITVIDLDGKQLDGRFPPPDETVLHTSIYRAREDVVSVVHVHPPKCVLFSIVGEPLVPVCQSAIRPFFDGPVPLFDKAGIINSSELADEMAETLGASRAMLLRGHGVAVVGKGVEDAVINTIQLEAAARWQYQAALLGKPRPLDLSSPLLQSNRTYAGGMSGVRAIFAYYEERCQQGRGPGDRE